MQRLLEKYEVADLLRISVRSVDRLIKAGVLETVVVGERLRRIPVDAVEQYIQSLREAPK
jgi:excisionase family DNA binding protein